MTAEIIQEKASWERARERVPIQDPYFSFSYHEAYQRHGDGSPLAYFYEEQGEALFYPFLLKPIHGVGDWRPPHLLYDIQSVYGYSGPLSTTRERSFLDRAWDSFGEWCAEQSVIAEFIRFHPLIENQELMNGTCRVFPNRPTISISLEGDENNLWERYPAKQRQNVRKAQKHGVSIRILDPENWLDQFQAVYESTMQRVEADRYYFFPKSYYRALLSGKPPVLMGAFLDEELLAALLLLQGTSFLHYHLGGSKPEQARFRANNLLFHEAALLGQRQGLRRLHLGGGASTSEDDALLRFKKTLSHEQHNFQLGARVHSEHHYHELCERWHEQGGARQTKFFLLYRLPLPSVG